MLEIGIYQIVGNETLKRYRTDGTGWDWGWADPARDWLFRLERPDLRAPFEAANACGFWVRNPVGFSALWHGQPDKVDLEFDVAPDFWKSYISNHFGNGIVTWHTPFLFRTRPGGSRILVCGPTNTHRDNAHPLAGIIETDWMSMSFTMNWRIKSPKRRVRFEVGEPILQVIPLARNPCLDLEEALVRVRRLEAHPELTRTAAPPRHATRFVPPAVRWEQGKRVAASPSAKPEPPVAEPEGADPQGLVAKLVLEERPAAVRRRRGQGEEAHGGLAAALDTDPEAVQETSGAPRISVEIFEADLGEAQGAAGRAGFEWRFADLHRDWMDATSNKYAYRCLPLTIANQTGIWVLSPVGFTATWHAAEDRVELEFDRDGSRWSRFIGSPLRGGTVTIETPFRVRTCPAGSRVLVLGPPNQLLEGLHPLTHVLESDGPPVMLSASFAVARAGERVRFEAGTPILQAIPLASDPRTDLERAEIAYRYLGDDPEIDRSYRQWSEGRKKLHELQAKGVIPQSEWQKHYFRGRKISGEEAPTEHFTKINPPEVIWEDGTGPAPQLESPGAPDALPAEAGKGATKPASKGDEAPAPGAASPAREAIASFGGLRVRAFRVHPRAARLAPAAPLRGPRAASPGFLVGSPVDLDIVWRGASGFDWKLRSPFGDEDAALLAAVLARSGVNGGSPPARKLDCARAGEGVLALYTGLVIETPPGFALEVRPSAKTLPAYAAERTLLETDRAPRLLVLNLRFHLRDRPVELRVGDPLAELLPIGRESFETPWLLGQVPIEASRDAADVIRRWREG